MTLPPSPQEPQSGNENTDIDVHDTPLSKIAFQVVLPKCACVVGVI